ncbi:hypothetical protein MRX96_028293 [Rhipicephalus microplus]
MRCACATGPPNRFASIDACYNSCGRMHGPMADRCFEKTLFTDCNRQDVWHNWWVFSGKDCVQWGFPHGLCPDDDGSDVGVFADEAACVERCLSSKDVGENRGCRRPKAKSCTEEQLRFPYFAEILASGRGHCVKATVENLLMHRCLIEAPRRRCSVCDATFTSARGLANHLRCHVDQAGPSGAARARVPAQRVRHVSSSTDTSSSSSGSPPPAASRASRRLRGLAPSKAAPSRFVDVRGLGLCPQFAGTNSCRKPGPLRAALAWSPLIGVPTPAGVTVDSPVPGSPRSPDSASPQRPSSSARQVLVPYDHRPSSSSNGEAPASRGTSAASPVGDAAFLTNDNDHNVLSDDVAVSSPPLDSGSSPVVLPGSPVSLASFPSLPTSVDEAAAVPGEPDKVPEQPESDNATLQIARPAL